MKKINTKQMAVVHLAAVVALSLIFLSRNVPKAECFSNADALAAVGCNSTRISDCLPDNEEFLMESETGGRILQAEKKVQTINYKPLLQNVPFCDAITYGSCIGRDSKLYEKRPCNLRNTCLRPV